MRKSSRPNMSILSSFRILKIGGRRREKRWRQREKEKGRKLRRCWKVIDKGRESGGSKRSNWRGPGRRRKERRASSSSSLKKWREIPRD